VGLERDREREGEEKRETDAKTLKPPNPNETLASGPSLIGASTYVNYKIIGHYRSTKKIRPDPSRKLDG